MGSVGFYGFVIAVVSAVAAWWYWRSREDRLRMSSAVDVLPVAPFWILVGIAVVAALVSVAMGVGLWITPKPEPESP